MTAPSAELSGEAPPPEAASASLRAWATEHPPLAALLASGVPKIQALLRWGIALLREGKNEDAASAFAAAAALGPQDPIAWTNYGVALDRCGRSAAAAVALERSTALDRLQPDVWILLSLSRKKLGDQAGAEAACLVALEQQPQVAVHWQCLGLLKEDQRDYAAAIDCFVACIQRGGATPAVLANLGKLYYGTCRIDEAYELFFDAVRSDPTSAYYRRMLRKTRFLRDVLRGDAVDDALGAFERAFAPPEKPTEKERLEVLGTAFGVFSGFGHIDAARRVGRKQRELQPSSSTVRYLLQALDAAPDLDRSPPDYIAEHFDAFAASFDSQLVRVLGYEVPARLVGLVRDSLPAERRWDVLDAGCGTGLCGPLLRPLARSLAGVDLAPKMLEQAAKRNVYDRLVCADLVPFLERSAGAFDLMTAADVMVYFGDLAPFFAGAAVALRPGGFLAFSTELLPPGQGFRLLPSGRFAHAPDYVRSAAGKAFVQETCRETTLRLEVRVRLLGNLFLFRRL